MPQPTLSALLQAIPNAATPGAVSSHTVGFCQAREFFQLAAHKNARSVGLQRVFQGSKLERVVLSNNLRDFECKLDGCTTEYLPKNFFKELTAATLPAIRQALAGALVIVNNNDAGQNLAGYSELYAHCTETLFAAWDWDNHHWLDLSAPLAAQSDIYAPGHHENLYLLSRYNWVIAGPIYCASVQWPRQLLVDSLPEMITTQRSNFPLGKHIPYAAFEFRNQVLSTLSQTFPSIGFSDRTFHVRNTQDRLKEWIGHKLHWISPVLNDVPIRVFDALITGGIPVVPESMRYLHPLSQISDRDILVYTAHDIINPVPLIERGVALFDEGGANAIVERHRYALANHHGDRAMERIRQVALQKFCKG